jgi:hypothetical protein
MIKTVKLFHRDADPEHGLTELGYFACTDEHGNDMVVPFDPKNSDYNDLRLWYESLEQKPFDFDFSQFDEDSN